jgi:type VII secretion protein EccB
VGPATSTDGAAPATRDQVDAYRFALRRQEAALVRGDPIPLHEQLRAQRRAVAAGAVLGTLGLVGAMVAAVVAPRPDWRDADLVVGTPSGALYAVAHEPDRLVPVVNAVAGRLVLAALRPALPPAVPPTVVDDGALADGPRTAAAAVPGAVAADPARTVPPHWAVCDEVAEGPGGPRLRGTTVVAGTADPLPAGPDADGVLLAVPGGRTWLVTSGQRHRIDPVDMPVRAALGLAGRIPRPASAGLVSALPEGVPLVTPDVPDRGAPAPRGVPGRVGDVLVSVPGGPRRHYLVLADGLLEVPPLAADVLVAASGRVVEVGPQVVAAARPPAPAGWPATAPRLREPADAPAVCWIWSGEPGADPAGGVHIGPAPSAGTPVAPDGATVVVGAGGAVRATAPGVPPGAGTLWVLTPGGVAHGVADDATAAALGITRVAPAPEAALRLLPTGPTLDVAGAGRTLGVAG